MINAYAYKYTQEQIQICESRIKHFGQSSAQRYCQHVYVFQKTYTPTDGMEINLDMYIQGKLFHPKASGFHGGGTADLLVAVRATAFFSAATALFANASISSSGEASFVFLSDLTFWLRNFFKSFLNPFWLFPEYVWHIS